MRPKANVRCLEAITAPTDHGLFGENKQSSFHHDTRPWLADRKAGLPSLNISYKYVELLFAFESLGNRAYHVKFPYQIYPPESEPHHSPVSDLEKCTPCPDLCSLERFDVDF